MKPTSGLTLFELIIVLGIIAIVTTGIFVSMRGNEQRALENASLALQADIRYAQRRAIMEGRRIGINFSPANNSYSIMTQRPTTTIRTVYLQSGVVLVETSHDQLMFLPRGTASSAFRITLRNDAYWQRITATLSGGQVRIHDITREALWNLE